MGVRKKYVPYDYEEAYTDELRKIEEEQQRKVAKGSIYVLKEIRSGPQLELEIYPEFSRWKDVPIEGRKKKKDNSTAQRDLNDRNARKTLERLVNANFGEGDLWITLTYDEDHLPADMEEATKNVRRYMQRVNYQRKKRGLGPAKYIYVTEHSEENEVRWHHHIIMDGAMDRDTVEACWKIRSRNQVRKIVPDEDGLTGMAKYITKDKLKRKKNERRWNCSKGLRQPEIRKTHTKRPAEGEKGKRQAPRRIRAYVNRILKDQGEIEEICRGWYPDYSFAEAVVFFNQYNQQYYIRARMRRIRRETKENGRPETKAHSSRKHLSAPGQSEAGPRRPHGADREHPEERDHAEPDRHSGTL